MREMRKGNGDVQFNILERLASELYRVAAAKGVEIDAAFHEAIVEYIKRWDSEYQKDLHAIIERLMKDHAWLLGHLRKGPD
jgi:hypothetical protein